MSVEYNTKARVYSAYHTSLFLVNNILLIPIILAISFKQNQSNGTFVETPWTCYLIYSSTVFLRILSFAKEASNIDFVWNTNWSIELLSENIDNNEV